MHCKGKAVLALARHAVKTYEEVKVKLYRFLSSVLNGGGWPDSCFDRFVTGERASGIHWVGV